jgi:hypothetical protein
MYEGNASAHGNTQMSDDSSVEEEEHESLPKVAIVGDALHHHGSAQLSDVEMQHSAYASSAYCDDGPVSGSGSESRF